MREKRRDPEVPEEEAPVVECFGGFARITSKELASTRSVKSGTLQKTAWRTIHALTLFHPVCCCDSCQTYNLHCY